MKVFRSVEELAGVGGPSVVTVGNFDGVHRGHQTVIRGVLERARELGAQAVAVTFDPHPLRVLQPDLDVKLITPLEQKLELLAGTGLDATVVLPFTAAFSQWSPREFAQRVMCDGLRAMEVHEGENFRFGHHAAADIAGLAELGKEMCFGVKAFHPDNFRGAPVSSTRTRRAIAEGRMSEARALLGRPFSIRSTPAKGRGYGTRYAVPTINLAPYRDLVPANGVYVTTLRVGSRVFEGVTNAGNRPTFGEDSYAIESHLFGFEPIELNEETPLELTFLWRLRGEQKFASAEELRGQIGRDVARARRYFALCRVVGSPAQ